MHANMMPIFLFFINVFCFMYKETERYSDYDSKLMFEMAVTIAIICRLPFCMEEIMPLQKNTKDMRRVVRFILVGVLNTAIDFAVLNILISAFGLGGNNHFLYIVFRSISFSVAVVNSFFWNKRWVFKRNRRVLHQYGEHTQFELGSFLGVSVVGLVINSLLALFFFSVMSPVLPTFYAANIGALIGTCGALAWNFIGYKKFVFKVA